LVLQKGDIFICDNKLCGNLIQAKDKHNPSAVAMILLISSSKDVASVNISNQILHHYPFSKTNSTFQESPVYSLNMHWNQTILVTLQIESVNAQDLANSFPCVDLAVFISRHSSASGTPTLSVHAPGNFGAANLGGLPNKLSVCPAHAMKDALNELSTQQKNMNLDYEVSYECTHHGPSLSVPAMFVELGSSEKQWSDELAAKAVAIAAMSAVANFQKVCKGTASLGIGGPHYNRQFTLMALRGDAIFGHMIPKYAVNLIDAEMLGHCVKQTLEPVEHAILDWKGIKSEDKPKLLSALKEIGLSYEKT
jgi:D-aminoacyl-tRNA deacylase